MGNKMKKTRKQLEIKLLIISYLLIMLILPILALFNETSIAFPEDFYKKAFNPITLSTYWITLSNGFITALINGFFGLIVAWILVKYDFWGKKIIDSTIALPTAVAGLTLSTVYSDQYPIGSFLNNFGIEVVYNNTGVSLAMLFVSFPFVVRTVQPVLEELEQDIEEVSWSLGGSYIETFFRIILPLIFPALITGIILAFSRAIGEYGSIVIIASNIPFRDLVASVLIFQSLEQYDKTGATIIGTIVLLTSLILLLSIPC